MGELGDLNDFIKYLYEQIGQPYVWGCQGTLLTPNDYEKIIDRREEKNSNRKEAKKYCKKKFDSGIKELRAYDCSGLGMYYLQNLKHIYRDDMNAHWMWKSCDDVKTAKRGYWVFHHNGARVTHVGYMVSDTEVVHAKGRSYGVVKEKFKKGSQWNRIGKPKCFNFDEENEQSVGYDYIFTRVLKYGCTGEDVIELKKLLIAKGFSSGISINKASSRNFYSSTKKMVKEFQKTVGIKADGVAGHDTIVRLGGFWLGD